MFVAHILVWMLAACGLADAANLYSKTRVRELTAKNFKQNVLANDSVTVVEFYAPWCGHCKSLKSDYLSSAKALTGLVNVAAVNCDNPGNKELCARYQIKGFPTIKVFQPAKKTDIDFKDLLEGKEVKPRRPKVFTYTGPRDSKSINKFALSKLRNYAASLNEEKSIIWLRPNLVPRVLMLPGAKYRSKSIAPLFKKLSSEYFGKMRFGYVPRRVDGAWNLLGLKAPDQSQLVYMADDRAPLVYQGNLTKPSVKRFLDEQYKLEMSRRTARDLPLNPGREDAANGLEWILEDKQVEEMEHVLKAREEEQQDQHDLLLARHNARQEIRKKNAEAEGKEFVPEEFTEAPTSTFVNPVAIPVATDIDDEGGEEAEDFEAPETASSPDDTEVDESAVDEELTADIDGADDAIDNLLNVILDEVDIDLLPEELVEEGPEYIAEYKAKLAEIRASYDESQRKRSSVLHAMAASRGIAMPGITPEAVPLDHDWLDDTHDVVRRCIRATYPCILLSTPKEFAEEDKNIFLTGRSRLPPKVNEKLVWNYFIDDSTDELSQVAEELGYKPYEYFRNSKEEPGVQKHRGRIAVFDTRKGKMAVGDTEFTAVDIAQFVVRALGKKMPMEPIPKKYRFYVTKDDIEYLENEERLLAQDEEAQKDAKDEL